MKTEIRYSLFIGFILFGIIGIFVLSIYNDGNISEDGQLKTFSSLKEIQEFLEQNSELSRNFYSAGIAESAKIMERAAGEDSDLPSTARAGAEDYSTTNIQVQGVDEADIVKNDGKYIYAVTENKVAIIDAFPPENMKVLSEIKIENPREIFINGEKLIIFSQGYNYVIYDGTLGEPREAIAEYSILPRPGGYPDYKTQIHVYDIGDKENPKLEQNISLDGDYIESRMIDDYVYVISSKYVLAPDITMPTYRINNIERKVLPSDIYYFDYPDTNYVFTSIISLNVEDGTFNNKVYLTGYASNIYVSKDNVYLTYTKRASYRDYIKRFAEEVAIPLFSDGEIRNIIDSEKDDYGKLDEITTLIYEHSSSLEGKEKEEFDEKFRKLTEEFSIKIQRENEKTVIHKIKIDEDKIEYDTAGEVNGIVLNQFSMDEYKEYFRIATTTEQFGRTIGRTIDSTTSNNVDTSSNHLYILGNDLKVVGKLEDLAKGERIYSARFIGDRAYLVTFKKIDPFYVIDVSEPENPEVLGYLKIPGYSDYLQPYDENHVIGIGKETAEADEDTRADFAWYRGVKISLFDVTDVANPKEKAKIEIGDRGTDSYALRDHKAFLFDRERNLLVVPITLAEIDEEEYTKQYGKVPSWAYGEIVRQGAYVLDIDLSEISIKGKISHRGENNGDKAEFYYDGRKDVQRALYMDDILYTISMSKIKANNLETIEEINEIDLIDDSENEPIVYPEEFDETDSKINVFVTFEQS